MWTSSTGGRPRHVRATVLDWRRQQDKCLREIERHQSADQHYLEEGISILEMASNAQHLFDNEQPTETAAPQFRGFELDLGEPRVERDSARTLGLDCRNGEVHFECGG
jgi:hypothetical protein